MRRSFAVLILIPFTLVACGSDNDGPEVQSYVNNTARIYSTKGHPKAEGLEITLKYPATWRAEEADRPHIVQKFGIQRGTGRDTCTLIVGRPKTRLSEKDIEALLSEDAFDQYVPEGGELLGGTSTSWDSLPALIVDVKLVQNQLGQKVVMYLRTYNTIYRNLWVQVHCGAADIEDSRALRDRFRRLSTSTFQLLANSVVFQSNWKNR